MMPRHAVLAVVLVVVVVSAAAQPASTGEAAPQNSSNEDPPGVGIKVSFRPSVAIVVGIFTLIFSLTFLLLIYAKFCHPSSSASSSSRPLPATLATISSQPERQQEQQGVPKAVVDSLPFFRFATLRGARRGMECAVCLSRFDDADTLRLLPRCRHAFHLACLDRWLEASATCPLCRAPVLQLHADDASSLGLKFAASARIVYGGSDDDNDVSAAGSGRDLLDIFVERVPSSRFPFPPPRQDQEEEKSKDEELDRHRHRIIVSDVVFRSRWSALSSADLIALDTEMLRSSTASVFPSSPDYSEYNNKLSSAGEEDVAGTAAIAEAATTSTEKRQLLRHGISSSNSSNVVAAAGGGGGVRGSLLLSSGVRSVSEIVSVPRRLLLHAPPAREQLAEEENRRWLPIARRTARWFVGRASGQGQEQEVEGGGAHVVAAQVV